MLQTSVKLCNLEQKHITNLRSSLDHTQQLAYAGSKKSNDQKAKLYLGRAHFVVDFCFIPNFEK